MLDHNLITPSTSPWSSPVVLVKKEGGQNRLCFDYRKINEVTKTDSYPLPRVEDCIDRIGSAKFITCWAQHNQDGSSEFVSQGPWVKVRRFVVPQYVALGKNATLECDYLVQKHASLYSLKWYKSNSQFYQYIPSNENPFSVFSVEGLHQDQVVASADGRRMVILGIQAAASDTYRCEMVAEGPPFHTTQRSGNMTVAVVPNERPLLTGSREYYHLNDLIKLNCTAPFAKPPISLTWYINDHEAELNNVNEIERIVNPAELESVSSQLTLSVKRHHFKGSTMSIKCVGRLADLYQRSSQVIIREPSSQWFINSDLYHTSGCAACHSYRLLQPLLLLQFLLYSQMN
ncbi:uncharacterized protein [Palaemon carinicauda]|uniref:uncharacterized protein n=1 Tax=Palaemon carinicauda TaxID=392227 RepID=UPI0035B5E5B0